MAYLFDTDALSEPLRRKPLPAYIAWLAGIPREEQFTSAVSVGEMYGGAFRSAERERHLRNIEERVLPAVSVLAYDVGVARLYGEIRAMLEDAGRKLPDADLQIAATAIHHDLELVTGNVRHFGRVPGLKVQKILERTRRPG